MSNQTKQIELRGALINGYTLVQQLSKNQFNEVFLAQNSKNKTKKVFVVFRTFNKYLKMAIQIIHTQQKQSNFQNIITVENYYDYKYKNIEFYIVELEKADKNFSEYYEKFKIMSSEQQKILKLQIMTQVTLGLNELHRRNIIHRDIKPENILMIGNNAFIGDLGNVRLFSKDDPPSTPINAENYSAPELYTNGKEYKFPVDIYSLGRLFLYILFGEPNINLAFQAKEQWQIEIGRLICDMILEDPEKRLTLDKILNKLDQLDETQKIEEPLQMKKVKQN